MSARDHIDGFPLVLSALACPLCKSGMRATPGSAARCATCGASYPQCGATWDLVPYETVRTDPTWQPWLHAQENGTVSYRFDPVTNLAVGDCQGSAALARFCAFDGPVLDVGCGPQDWPAYFALHSSRTSFVGVDPLIDAASARYPQLRALGEYLPFVSGVFRHVVFATSVDHLIRPAAALSEAARVLTSDGEIVLWVGEKDSGEPAPAESPEWYVELVKPEGADDKFHLKRLDRDDVHRLTEIAGLQITEERVLPVSTFRRNCFFRLRPVSR